MVPKSGETTLNFSLEEQVLFERRYEEGYDITTDVRYNAWLNLYHPTGSTSKPCHLLRSSSCTNCLMHVLDHAYCHNF